MILNGTMNKHDRNRKVARILSLLMIASVVLMMAMFSSEAGDQSSTRSEQVARFVAKTFVAGYEQMSAQARAKVVERLQLPVRKAAHMAEFALLGCWLYVFMHTQGRRCVAGMLWALLCAVALACIDEGHQMFVSGRGPSLRDVGIDSIGAVLGIVLSVFVTDKLSKWSKRRTAL